MRAPLMVEFVGVPGCGKSSLSRAVAEKLRSEGHEARTVIDAARARSAEGVTGRLVSRLAPRRLARFGLWWIFYLTSSLRAVAVAWRDRRAVVRLTAYQAHRPIKFALKAHIVWWFLQLGGRRSYLESSRSIDAILFDDGYVHRSVALFSSPRERPLEHPVRGYIQDIPAPSMIVQVLAPVSTCLDRVTERGIWSHSSHLTGPELREYLSSAEHVLQIAVGEAAKRGVPVLSVSNDDTPLEHATSRVSEELENLLNTAATGRAAP